MRGTGGSQGQFTEAQLVARLRALEALFAGATTPGEGAAAERARERIVERLRAAEALDPPVEHQFSMPDAWSHKVFVALLRRYGIAPYRRRGQRYTTVLAEVSKRFVDETLWPHFEEVNSTLRQYLSEVTERVVREAVHGDVSDAAVEDGPRRMAGAEAQRTALPTAFPQRPVIDAAKPPGSAAPTARAAITPPHPSPATSTTRNERKRKRRTRKQKRSRR